MVFLLALGIGAGPAAADSIFDSVAGSAAKNDLMKVYAMLSEGKSPNDPDDSGNTALIYAAKFSNVTMVQILLQHNADPDHRDQFGNTALHWAAEQGDIDIIRYLIAYRANVDAQNREGLTPLMMAAREGKALATRLLIDNGADPRKEDYTGRDALGWATMPNVVQLLRKAQQQPGQQQ
jgi:ankyrin repeat protein